MHGQRLWRGLFRTCSTHVQKHAARPDGETGADTHDGGRRSPDLATPGGDWFTRRRSYRGRLYGLREMLCRDPS